MEESNDSKPTDEVEGVVASYDNGKGWGFIALGDGTKDVFVHHEAIHGECARTLTVGDRVRFKLIKGPKGPRADSVVKL